MKKFFVTTLSVSLCVEVIFFLPKLAAQTPLESVSESEKKVEFSSTLNKGMNKFQRINVNEDRLLELKKEVDALRSELEALKGEVATLKGQNGPQRPAAKDGLSDE